MSKTQKIISTTFAVLLLIGIGSVVATQEFSPEQTRPEFQTAQYQTKDRNPEKYNGPPSILPSEFAEKIDREKAVKIIDVRTPEEFATGHLQKAKNLDIYSPNFKEQLNPMDRDGIYGLYCRSGKRSQEAMAVMSEMGFSNIFELKDGIISWVNSDKKICVEC